MKWLWLLSKYMRCLFNVHNLIDFSILMNRFWCDELIQVNSVVAVRGSVLPPSHCWYPCLILHSAGHVDPCWFAVCVRNCFNSLCRYWFKLSGHIQQSCIVVNLGLTVGQFQCVLPRRPRYQLILILIRFCSIWCRLSSACTNTRSMCEDDCNIPSVFEANWYAKKSFPTSDVLYAKYKKDTKIDYTWLGPAVVTQMVSAIVYTVRPYALYECQSFDVHVTKGIDHGNTTNSNVDEQLRMFHQISKDPSKKNEKWDKQQNSTVRDK